MSKEKTKLWRVRIRFCKELAYLLLCAFSFYTPPLHAYPSLQVKRQDGRFTITAKKVPRSQILQALARQTGLEIHNLQGLEEEISVRLEGLSLRESLQQLLANVNYYLQEETSSNRNSQLILLPGSGQGTVSFSLPSAVTNKSQQEESPEEHLAELFVFAEQGNEAALRKSTSDSNQIIRQTAFELLAKQNPSAAADLAAAASRSQMLEQQYTGLQILGGLDDPLALQTLGESLSSEDVGVREVAVRGLINQTPKEAIRFLSQALKDPEPSIRMLALEGLAERGAEGKDALTLAIQSSDAVIQARATELLEKITANEEEVRFSNDSN